MKKLSVIKKFRFFLLKNAIFFLEELLSSRRMQGEHLALLTWKYLPFFFILSFLDPDTMTHLTWSAIQHSTVLISYIVFILSDQNHLQRVQTRLKERVEANKESLMLGKCLKIYWHLSGSYLKLRDSVVLTATALSKLIFYGNHVRTVCAALYYSQLPAHQNSLMAARAIPYSACRLGPPRGNGTRKWKGWTHNLFIQLAFVDKADMRFKPENRKDPLTMICI